MSLFSNVSMLSSAAQSFQYALNVNANNLANMMTPGYSMQSLVLDPMPSIYNNGLFLGQGVTATSIARSRDAFLDAQIKFELSELGASTARSQALTELGAIFPEVAAAGSTAGLQGAITNVTVAWTNLIASPNSIALKTAVRDSLKAVADMLQSDARKVFDLQVNLNDQVNTTISQVNNLSDQIASMNAQIKAMPGGGLTAAPGALLDMRERAAEQLAQLVDATFRVGGDGLMTVTFGTGVLVDGGTANHLIAINSPYDPGRTAVGYAEQAGAKARDVTASIQGGKLGGLLQARDGDVEKARLDLNRIAFGIITRSNEINRTYVAGDGTTGHDLFIGRGAADIVLNPIVAGTPDYVGGTRDALAPGDLAKIQGQLQNFIQFSSMRTATGSSLGGGFIIDPTQPLSTQIFANPLNVGATPGTPGQIVFSTSGNAVTVNWDNTQTLNQVIRNINAAGAGAFYATFDASSQQIIVVGQTPMTVYDTNFNLGETLMISSSVISSTPINNYPVPGSNQVDPVGAMNNTQNKLNLYTTPLSTGGTVLIDGVAVNWNPSQDIQITLALAINAATPSPQKISLSWDATNQIVLMEKSGDPTANPGALNFGLGNTMTAIQVVDQKGNLSRTLNLDTNTNATKILSELVVALGSRQATQQTLVKQAQALVDQTTTLQKAESDVFTNQTAIQAQDMAYQRSYEASLRLMFIMDDMLNVLINRTGSSAAPISSTP